MYYWGENKHAKTVGDRKALSKTEQNLQAATFKNASPTSIYLSSSQLESASNQTSTNTKASVYCVG